jgi:molybdopterin synthase catalytic subunit
VSAPEGRVDVRSGPISADEAIGMVAHAGAGGIALFLGVVRDTNDGRAVTLLEYEAYGSMALAEMEKIRKEIETEIGGARVAALHRVGALSVGDVAVVCVASAPHRAEAFRACRLMIDRLKERVPIWKREHGPEGPYWVGWEDARCTPDHPHSHENLSR